MEPTQVVDSRGNVRLYFDVSHDLGEKLNILAMRRRMSRKNLVEEILLQAVPRTPRPAAIEAKAKPVEREPVDCLSNELMEFSRSDLLQSEYERRGDPSVFLHPRARVNLALTAEDKERRKPKA